MREENLNRLPEQKSFVPSERQTSGGVASNYLTSTTQHNEGNRTHHVPNPSIVMAAPTHHSGRGDGIPTMLNKNIPGQQGASQSPNDAGPKEEEQTQHRPSQSHPLPAVFPVANPTSMGIHAIVVDSCPPFTPGAYSNWRREVRL